MGLPKLTKQQAVARVLSTTPLPTGCIVVSRHPGYKQVVIDGAALGLHRVMLEHKLGRPIATGLLALHTCDHKPCVNPDHLYEGTYFDNNRDTVARGRFRSGATTHPERMARGESHGCARLCDAEVIEIRRARAAGERTESIAGRYLLDVSHVRDIVSGRAWRHVGGPLVTAC